MNDNEIEEWKNKINNMNQTEMASLWRFAPAGHPIFRNDLPLFEYFKKRFDGLGGMTPKISKNIGW